MGVGMQYPNVDGNGPVSLGSGPPSAPLHDLYTKGFSE